jgi:hypothetical protein
MRWRRWTLALVITMMVIDAWMSGAEAKGPRRGIGPDPDRAAMRP